MQTPFANRQTVLSATLAIFTATTLLVGCGSPEVADTSSAPPPSELPLAYTANYPLQYFAERIGGDAINTQFPAPPDVDPAFWTPDPETISQYQQADLIFLNGAGYSQWLATASLPASKSVYTSAPFQDQYLQQQDCSTHSHGPEGDHSHCEFAFTTWLDPQLAILQARSIRDSLTKLLPEQQQSFDQTYQSLEADLQNLDRQLETLISSNPDLPLLFSHPVYDYPIRRYQLNAKSLHWEPNEFPDETQWQELELIQADFQAQWMIWEGEPLPETAEKLAEMGIVSIVFDPVANVPESGDYLTAMQQNIENLTQIFGESAATESQ